MREESELREGGWKPFHDPYRYHKDSPYLHEWVWLTRAEWDEPQKANPRELHPALNVIGLWFMPVEDGIRH